MPKQKSKKTSPAGIAQPDKHKFADAFEKKGYQVGITEDEFLKKELG